ncbi:TPA: hypothetical protein ACSQQD_005304, partial [Pseudomonas aeruginosa]
MLGLAEEHPRAVVLEVGAQVGGELFFLGGGGIQLRCAEEAVELLDTVELLFDGSAGHSRLLEVELVGAGVRLLIGGLALSRLGDLATDGVDHFSGLVFQSLLARARRLVGDLLLAPQHVEVDRERAVGVAFG